MNWAKNNIDQVEGVIAEAGYVNQEIADPAANFGARVLTLGAEKDTGNARITRIAESFDQMKTSSIGYSKSKYSYPVVELFGLGSASFISGTPPLAI